MPPRPAPPRPGPQAASLLAGNPLYAPEQIYFQSKVGRPIQCQCRAYYSPANASTMHTTGTAQPNIMSCVFTRDATYALTPRMLDASNAGMLAGMIL